MLPHQIASRCAGREQFVPAFVVQQRLAHAPARGLANHLHRITQARQQRIHRALVMRGPERDHRPIANLRAGVRRAVECGHRAAGRLGQGAVGRDSICQRISGAGHGDFRPGVLLRVELGERVNRVSGGDEAGERGAVPAAVGVLHGQQRFHASRDCGVRVRETEHRQGIQSEGRGCGVGVFRIRRALRVKSPGPVSLLNLT